MNKSQKKHNDYHKENYKDRKRKEVDQESNISYENEIIRKALHLLSLLIPIIYIFVSKQFALTVLIPMALATIIGDWATKKYPSLRKIRAKTFGKIMRPDELQTGRKLMLFNGASWVLISACIVIAIFPKFIAIVSFSILILSDLAAALIGRIYGKTSIPLTDKSMEGTSAFVAAGVIVIVAYGLIFDLATTYYAIGIASVLIASIAEAYSENIGFDDNLLIPVTAGFSMWGLAAIFTDLSEEFVNLL